jgi:hypothetical protein
MVDGEGEDPSVDAGQLQSSPQLSHLTIIFPRPTYITVQLSRVLSSETLLLPHLQNPQISGRNHGSAVPRNDGGVLPYPKYHNRIASGIASARRVEHAVNVKTRVQFFFLSDRLNTLSNSNGWSDHADFRHIIIIPFKDMALERPGFRLRLGAGVLGEGSSYNL